MRRRGCPATGVSLAPAVVRTSGVDLVQAGDTVVPAILALEAGGYDVTQEGRVFVAKTGAARFAAEDPVALLGLVRLAEIRRPWRASDSEIDDVMDRFRVVAPSASIGELAPRHKRSTARPSAYDPRRFRPAAHYRRHDRVSRVIL
jgi:hypothetical protein